MTSKKTKFSFQRRQDSTSSYHCCVPSCTASARCNSALSFFTFPKDTEQRRKWTINIRRDQLIVTNNTRVCTRHFFPADVNQPSTPQGRRLLRRGALPVLFEWNNYSLPAPRPGVWEQTERPNPPSDDLEDLTEEMEVACPDHDYCSSAEPAAVDIVLNENAALRRQVEEMAISCKFGLERFAASDDDIRLYTRFASYAHLMSFWGLIEPALPDMVRVTRTQTATPGQDVRHAIPTSLQPIDEFFLFMNYLSLDMVEKDLANRFKVHQATVSRIISTWANFLYEVLGAIGIWLDEETIKQNMPEEWPHSHKNVGQRKRERHEQATPHDKHNLSLVVPNNDTEWKRPRCGVPDYPTLMQVDLSYYNLKKKKKEGLSRQQRKKRFALFGGRWEKTNLTYRIVRFPWQLSEAKVRRVLDEAFRVWGAVTPLTFTEVMSEKADIVIDFNRYWHGDSLPFDGPGGILAHAFFPRTQREGEVHFDYDEHWTVGNDVGRDLLQVAAHEFGHVLGLQHSLEPGAIMCPFYSDFYPLKLSEDDKMGIQYLYGAPRQATPEIAETNEIDIGMPDACRTNFDAVSMIRGELFFFKSQYVWRIRDGKLQAGYPALASRHWRGIPDYIDAAYEDNSGNIWFFQGGSYWVFDAEKKITGPDSVRWLGLPVTNIQAALKWDVGNVQKVYLFKSSTYWAFNPLENRVDNVHPRGIHEWSGMPSHIDAAFQDRYGYANFLSGMQYWKFDPVALKAVDGYPRNIGMDFFGCSTYSYK